MDQTHDSLKVSIEDPLDVEKNQPSETTFYCTVCYDKFSDSNSFSSHMDKVHNKKIYACNVCHRRYKNKRNYNLHIESAHKEELGSDLKQSNNKFVESSNVNRQNFKVFIEDPLDLREEHTEGNNEITTFVSVSESESKSKCEDLEQPSLEEKVVLGNFVLFTPESYVNEGIEEENLNNLLSLEPEELFKKYEDFRIEDKPSEIKINNDISEKNDIRKETIELLV